ncbi:MAG: PAS domain-containing protein [Bacteroidetes bacterium]|nr:PAS domain-containing protein [Bacteroidota bacterium]
MQPQNSIQEIVFTFFQQYQFAENDIDYRVLDAHIHSFESLAQLSNSGVSIFDLNTKKTIFYSSNYGKLLGFQQEDFAVDNYNFFEARIHPDEQHTLAVYGVSSLKMFNAFSLDEKLAHKAIYEYRMRNADEKYVRLVEQYQVLEVDVKGRIWLMVSIVDISPNQDAESAVKCRLLNFKNGNQFLLETSPKLQLELTPRELEILRLVKDGLLSKEISDKLAISVHTVNTHRQRVLEKLGANNSIEAVSFASKYGLLA